MIRFFILCVVFLLLYHAFNIIGEYNSAMQLIMFDYQMDTSLFAFLVMFVLFQLASIIVFKCIFVIFDLPQILKRRWNRKKIHKLNSKLISALAELLMGRRKKSLAISKKLTSHLEKDDTEFQKLILAESSDEFEKKIRYLQELVDKKYYSIYSAKKLAQLFYENEHHKRAEKYALKAFNEDDTDTETMLVLIRIYGALSLWPKLVFIVSKLQRANAKLLAQHSMEIAGFYHDAAKASLKDKKDDEAMSYLESALEVRPDYLNALNLFSELSTNLKNSASALKVLKSAFAASPSFEVARIYAQNAKSSPDVIYGTLASVVSSKQYVGLFLSIAAYLGLPDKIEEIKTLNK